MALYGEPLFAEQIEAWQYGPVIPEAYQTYQQYKGHILPPPEHVNLDQYSPEIQELLDEVYEVYGQYTAPNLMRFTHQEPPWQTTAITEAISHASMQSYFQTQLVK